MQIVIDIPEYMYNDIKNCGYVYPVHAEDLASYIIGGTPLPKGHGRLIDADAYLAKERPRGIDEDTWKESHIYKSITGAPTIIDVDKMESEDKA